MWFAFPFDVRSSLSFRLVLYIFVSLLSSMCLACLCIVATENCSSCILATRIVLLNKVHTLHGVTTIIMRTYKKRCDRRIRDSSCTHWHRIPIERDSHTAIFKYKITAQLPVNVLSNGLKLTTNHMMCWALVFFVRLWKFGVYFMISSDVRLRLGLWFFRK